MLGYDPAKNIEEMLSITPCRILLMQDTAVMNLNEWCLQMI